MAFRRHFRRVGLNWIRGAGQIIDGDEWIKHTALTELTDKDIDRRRASIFATGTHILRRSTSFAYSAMPDIPTHCRHSCFANRTPCSLRRTPPLSPRHASPACDSLHHTRRKPHARGRRRAAAEFAGQRSESVLEFKRLPWPPPPPPPYTSSRLLP